MCKIIHQTNVEQTEGNGVSYFLFIPLCEPSSSKFPWKFSCDHQPWKLPKIFINYK